MPGIEAALRLSAASATDFTRSIFGGERWTSSQVIDFVNATGSATIATTNSNGQPHAAFVIAASVRDAIYFTVSPRSALARNLIINDRLAFSVCDGGHAVMGQGRDVDVGAASQLAALIAELAAASPTGRFTPDDWEGQIHTIDLRRIFAS